jgi:hypothetical protein
MRYWRVSYGMASGQIIRSSELDCLSQLGDLFLVKVLLYRLVQAIQEDCKNFLLRWVFDQAQSFLELFHVDF